MWPLIIFGIPVLLSVFIFEFLSAQMYFVTGSENIDVFVLFRIAHLIPAFVFAYISDKNYRKGALFTSHLLGLVAVSTIYIFGFTFWALILVALVFNPLAVARAALLDNFSHYSTLKLMAVVFVVKMIPWIVFNYLRDVGFLSEDLLNITVLLFCVNAVFIGLFFQDKRDIFVHSHPQKKTHFLKGMKRKVIYLVLAFTLAQVPIRIAWDRIYYYFDVDIAAWTSVTTYSLMIGIICAMLYKCLPHLSILTLTYILGVCVMLALLLERSFGVFPSRFSFVGAMNYYCVIGGMTLPFAADAIITMFGSQKKAIGAMMIDISESGALLIAAMISRFFSMFFYADLFFSLAFFFIASVLQKHIERRHVSTSDS